MLENQLFHHKLHCNGWKSWSWGLKRSWVQRAHSQTATQPVFLSPLSKKCFLLMWTFRAFSISKDSLHRLQEECSPCSSHASSICRLVVRARQENRPVARKHDSKVQSGPMQESVSLPGKKLFKTDKKEDHQEASRQLNKKTNCS